MMRMGEARSAFTEQRLLTEHPELFAQFQASKQKREAKQWDLLALQVEQRIEDSRIRPRATAMRRRLLELD